MINLVTALSKYLMILLIAIYTYYNFRFFAMPEEESKKRVCRLQNAAMFLLHTLAYSLFCGVPEPVPDALPEPVQTVIK